MAFLQPWMLYALPAILLPLVIHLLNRLRYKTVHWGAMMFLLKANKAATRRAKIKQYILLAIRMLLIFFLIWAMSRPLVGGWIGAAAGGAPETVLILLDRSASMESTSAERQAGKRQHALTLLSQAARQSEGSHFVLIESALREPLEIADGTSLASMKMTGATEASADLPSMFRTALDYLTKNKPGSAEVWVASDLQSSNWRPDSPEWQDISARLAGLPNETHLRVLDLSSAASRNASVILKSAELRTRGDKGQLSLTVEIKSTGQSGNLPMFVTRNGAKSQVDVPLTSAVQRQNFKFDLAKTELSGGSGFIELPADDLTADNTAYFVYSPQVPLATSIISDGPAALRLKFAAAPDKSQVSRRADILPAARADAITWKETALILWQAGTPTDAVARQLESFVEAGGVLVCFPPATDAAAGPLGLTWNAPEDSPAEGPFQLPSWDDLDGPLARTDNGSPLPVARLEILRRQIPTLTDPATHVYATFGDGRPFLSGRRQGAGHLFACATLPVPEWSNLGDGLVLLPMAQRMLLLGGKKLAPPALGLAGEWKPSDEQESWTPVDSASGRDWRWNSGIYQSGEKRVALNHPEIEDAPDAVPTDRIKELLRGAKLTVLSDALDLKADRLQSEIWPIMIFVAMLAMCAEMLLATSKGLLPVKPALKAAGARVVGTDANAAKPQLT